MIKRKYNHYLEVMIGSITRTSNETGGALFLRASLKAPLSTGVIHQVMLF